MHKSLWAGVLGLLLLLAGTVALQPGPSRTLSRELHAAGRGLSATLPISGTALYLPLIDRPEPTPTPTTPSVPAREWDPRLDQRGAELRPAVVQAGQGYWRLVKAVWMDEAESQGRHHIFADALDVGGQRVVGLPVRIYWAAGETIVNTQAKPGEPYAADFGMFDVAPSYGAKPNDGNPADELWGMGLGSIEQPFHSIHTSYGLTWQWTIDGGSEPLPTATPTPSPTATPTAGDGTTATVTPTATLSPTPTATPTATTQPDVAWDPRLTQRGASLQKAAVSPGQGYWKLVEARWYDETESAAINRQHILLDALEENGRRKVGLGIRVYWEGGEANLTTEAKPGETYAANFPLQFPAPFYNAAPNDGSPADAVLGMGLGSLSNPNSNTRASYGLVWRWTIAPQPTATPTATPTHTITPIVYPTYTYPTYTHTPTRTPTPTWTPTPTITPTPTWTPTLTPTVTPTATPTATSVTYLFNRAELVKCEPNAGVTYVEGTLRLDGQPANGYRVAFSYAPDGPVVAETISGPHAGYDGWNPGFYSHLLQVGGPRAGDWWFWVMDGTGARISQMGFVRTHATAGDGQCQQAVMDFHSQ